jgi:DNA mismatch endonuclease, patch repair protein
VPARDTPKPSSVAVAKRMRNTRQRDTELEVAIRKELFRRGYRYRIHPRLPGITRARPDFAFMRQKVAVFVDGCFWHWCPKHGTLPEKNAGWWGAKLQENVERDRRHKRELRRGGWAVVRVWEHEDLARAARRILYSLQRVHTH